MEKKKHRWEPNPQPPHYECFFVCILVAYLRFCQALPSALKQKISGNAPAGYHGLTGRRIRRALSLHRAPDAITGHPVLGGFSMIAIPRSPKTLAAMTGPAFDLVGMGLNSLCLAERLRRGHISDDAAGAELVITAERCSRFPSRPRRTTDENIPQEDNVRRS